MIGISSHTLKLVIGEGEANGINLTALGLKVGQCIRRILAIRSCAIGNNDHYIVGIRIQLVFITHGLFNS